MRSVLPIVVSAAEFVEQTHCLASAAYVEFVGGTRPIAQDRGKSGNQIIKFLPYSKLALLSPLDLWVEQPREWIV